MNDEDVMSEFSESEGININTIVSLKKFAKYARQSSFLLLTFHCLHRVT